MTVVGRYGKVWEGQDAFLVLQIAADQRKGYLVIDARSRKVEATTTKPEGLKPAGAVSSLLRKHAPSGGLGAVLRGENGWWVPLFTERKPEPTHLVHLSTGSPAEITLVTSGGTALVRRSTKGTYTKAKPWEGALPPPLGDAAVEDVSRSVLQGLDESSDQAEDEAAPSATESEGERALLPEFQRQARDRLARRLKTVRKALTTPKGKTRTADDLTRLERHAKLLGEHLHRVEEGAFELVLDDDTIPLDPDASPGHNLDRMYVEIKKTRKALKIEAEQRRAAAEQVRAMEADLASLRAGPLAMAAVERILERYKLPMTRDTQRTGPGGEKMPVALPWRSYVVKDGDDERELLVGRNAAGNDALCRAARSSDWWIHAVGATGSHVIIPARQLRGKPPTAALVRAAAILALQWSQRRDDRRGEVYVTQRQHIKKRPGMAPGLWQIDKAETLFVSYNDEDLQAVLAAAKP